MKTDRCTWMGLALALALAVVWTSGCGHFVTAKVQISKKVMPIEQPPAEIIASKTFFAKRPSLKKVSIFFMMNEANSHGKEFLDRPEIRELERSFVKGGFQVLEVRQIAKVKLEQFIGNKAAEEEAAKKGQLGQGSDFIVVVYTIRDNEEPLNYARASGSTVFEYGGSLDSTTEMEPRDIDAEVGAKGSMKNVVRDAKARLNKELALHQKGIPMAKLEAKLIDTKSREVLLFYKSFTVLKENIEAEKDEDYKKKVGDYEYDSDKQAFVRHVEEQAEEEEDTDYDYGKLSGATEAKAKSLSIKSDYLRRIEKACDALVDAIKNYKG